MIKLASPNGKNRMTYRCVKTLVYFARISIIPHRLRHMVVLEGEIWHISEVPEAATSAVMTGQSG